MAEKVNIEGDGRTLSCRGSLYFPCNSSLCSGGEEGGGPRRDGKPDDGLGDASMQVVLEEERENEDES